MVTDGTDCQVDEPPAAAGSEGGLLSIMTVLPAPFDAGAHADTFPAVSFARI